MSWHTVREGENWSSIAKQYIGQFKLKISSDDFIEILKKYNPHAIRKPKYPLYADDRILVPIAGLKRRRKVKLFWKRIPFKIEVKRIKFYDTYHIYGVNSDNQPDWESEGDNLPVCYEFGETLKMSVDLKIEPPLAVTKKISLKLNYGNQVIYQKDDINISGSNHRLKVETNYEVADEIARWTINFSWSYQVEEGDWKSSNSTGPHTIYTIFGQPDCDPSDFTLNHLDDSVTLGWEKSTETDIAAEVCKNVNGEVTSGCVCDNPDFEYHWRGLKGEHSEGMCCCRAKGMILVLQVLGVGDYMQDYVNENPEPNTRREFPHNAFCVTCLEVYGRAAWGGGIYNTWQGVCKKGDGEYCWSPQGPHAQRYNIMNRAPEYPNNQLFDAAHAFEHYAWIRKEGPNWIRCPHLPKPQIVL